MTQVGKRATTGARERSSRSSGRIGAKSVATEITAFEVVTERGTKVPKGSTVIPPSKAAGRHFAALGLKPVKLPWSATASKSKRPATALEPPAGREMDPSAFAPGARARALLRGIERAEQDLRESGGALDLEQVRVLMRGVTRQGVEKRVRENSLLAVPGPSNRRRYPAVQFMDDGSVVAGLREVQSVLPTRNGWAILNFLVRPDGRVGGRKPIDLLKAGKVDLVIEAARRMGEQGA